MSEDKDTLGSSGRSLDVMITLRRMLKEEK